MDTTNVLKDRGNILGQSWAARARPGFAAALLLAMSLLLGANGVQAQLSLGGAPEEGIDQALEDTVQDQVEEQVEERVLVLGAEAAESAIEDKVDDALEGEVENTVDQAVEDTAQQQVEETIQEQVEEQIEERVLVLGAEAIDSAVEDKVDAALQDTVEDAVEHRIEYFVGFTIDIKLEETVEEDIEQVVEETVADLVEESVETLVEERVEEVVADSAAQAVEESIEEAVADNAAQAVEESVELAVEGEVAASAERVAEIQVATAVAGRVEEGVEEIMEMIEVDEDRIQKDEWLVMASPEVFEELAEEGYLFQTVSELPGMGLRLAEVAAPSSFNVASVRQGVIDIVGSDRAEVDLNHIYTAGIQAGESAGQGILPRAAVDFPADTEAMPLRIGMIDSQVDTSHPALRNANIVAHSFAAEGALAPTFHGTAIASILVGNGGGYVGIAPSSEVFAASVFEQDPERGEIASTVSLVKALDWLIASGVDVINISLAGPPNRLLEAALQRASESDVIILAAAGNGGPVAQPMYPAAYNTVVAVTAVDADGKIFRLANRGDYLDIAAPGVEVRHADSAGGFTSSSGTSFAVPFAATAVARLRQLQPADDALEMLCRTAEDLGPPGRDSIYGFGLLRPASS